MKTHSPSIETSFTKRYFVDSLKINSNSKELKRLNSINSENITIQTTLSSKELVEKLRSFTITDFSKIYDTPNALYYGSVTSYNFSLMNVRYGPQGSYPPILGEIEEGVNNSIVNVKMNIKEHYIFTRNIFYSVLVPIAIIVLLLSILVLGGTEYQIYGLIFSVSFISIAIIATVLSKSSLVNAKNREIRELAFRINGKIISE